MVIQVRDLKDSFQLLLAGMLIGVGMIIPGVSGGVMAVIFGIYEPIIAVIAHPFKNLRENIKFGLPLALGAVISVLVLSQILNYFLTHHPLLVKYLFIGLLAGSLPALADLAKEKGFDRRYYCTFVIGLGIILFPLLLAGKAQSPVVSENEITGWQAVLSGFLVAAGTVVPGVSSSFLLMIAGTYSTLLRSLAEFNIIPLIPVIISGAGSALLLSRLTQYFLANFYGWTYYCLLGIIVGSIVVVFPGLPSSIPQGSAAVMLLLLGASASWRLSRQK